MICYFANRELDILAQASTRLHEGLHIKDDKRIEEIDDGTMTFTGYLCYESGQRQEAEAACEPGNYIIRRSADEKDEFYTIIDSDVDTLNREVYFYGEPAGLELIGEILEPYEATELMTLQQYVDLWTEDTGFTLGIDETDGIAKMLAWDDSESATERLLSTAEKFGCEMSYRFEVDGMKVMRKFIDFHITRGEEQAEPIRRGRDFEDMRISKSLANICTALRVTGGTPDGAGIRRKSDDTFTWVKFSEYNGGRDYEGEVSMTDDPSGMLFVGVSPGHATDEESEIPEDYSWGMINKKSTYIAVPSAKGHRQWKDVGGKVRYVWIVFATDTQGSNMSDYPTDRAYLGFKSGKTQEAKGTLASLYNWCPIDSDRAGRNIYISPGTTGISEGNGRYTWIKFADDAEGNGLTDNPVDKEYMGMRFHMTTQAESTDPADYEWKQIDINTNDGGFVRATYCCPGILMPDGTFTWFWFAENGTGKNMSVGTAGRPYLGLAYGKTSSLQSTDPNDYEWSLIDADESQAVTLNGMDYDDGDIYIENGMLRSRTANRKWADYVKDGRTYGNGIIIGEYESDATNQEELLQEAIAELKRRSEPEITYEIELTARRDDLHIGDTVPVVDHEGRRYMSARVIKLEVSEEKDTKKIALSNFDNTHKTSMTAAFQKLAKQQRELAEAQRANYTWVVYADSPTGDGIRLDSEDAMYMGVAYNKVTQDPNLNDPYEYVWTRIGGIDGDSGKDGQDGEDAVTLRVDSTRGLVFKNNWYDTQLRVTVIKGANTITDLQSLRAEFGDGAHLQWYWRKQADQAWSAMSVSDSHISEGGFCLTVTPDDVDEQITFQCDLEA